MEAVVLGQWAIPGRATRTIKNTTYTWLPPHNLPNIPLPWHTMSLPCWLWYCSGPVPAPYSIDLCSFRTSMIWDLTICACSNSSLWLPQSSVPRMKCDFHATSQFLKCSNSFPKFFFKYSKIECASLWISWSIPQKVTHTFTVLTAQIMHTLTFSTCMST